MRILTARSACERGEGGLRSHCDALSRHDGWHLCVECRKARVV